MTVWLEGWSQRRERGFVDVGLQALGGGTVTLNATHRRLQYTKEGRQVTYTGILSVDSVSSPLGELRITGLSHTCGSSAGGRRDFWTNLGVGISGAGVGPTLGQITSGQNSIGVFKYAAGNLANCASDIISGTDIYVNATFFTDN